MSNLNWFLLLATSALKSHHVIWDSCKHTGLVGVQQHTYPPSQYVRQSAKMEQRPHVVAAQCFLFFPRSYHPLSPSYLYIFHVLPRCYPALARFNNLQSDFGHHIARWFLVKISLLLALCLRPEPASSLPLRFPDNISPVCVFLYVWRATSYPGLFRIIPRKVQGYPGNPLYSWKWNSHQNWRISLKNVRILLKRIAFREEFTVMLLHKLYNIIFPTTFVWVCKGLHYRWVRYARPNHLSRLRTYRTSSPQVRGRFFSSLSIITHANYSFFLFAPHKACIAEEPHRKSYI